MQHNNFLSNSVIDISISGKYIINLISYILEFNVRPVNNGVLQTATSLLLILVLSRPCNHQPNSAFNAFE